MMERLQHKIKEERFEKKVMAKNSTKKNFLYNMVYQVALMVLPLITMPYISRVLGADGIGTYSYTHSIAQYFLLFGMLGINNHGNRSIAKVRDDKQERDKTFSSIYTLQLLTSFLSLLAYFVYIIFFCENKIFAFIQSFYVFSGMFDINWFFFGMEDFKITVVRKISIKVINLICIFAFVKSSSDLWKYLLVLSLGYFIAQSSMWLFAKKYVHFNFTKISDTFPHIKDVLILFIPVIATNVYTIMDKIMVGYFNSMQQLGLYENSEKLINVCVCVISAFGGVMMPKMSNLYAKNKLEKCDDIFVRTMEVAMFIACAITFGISSVAKEFIPVFYGDGYEQCIVITIMLSSTVLFITWANIIRNLYLIPAEKNKIFVTSVVLGAVINLIVNFIMIPRFASIGAAVGTIVAQVTVAVYQSIQVRKDLDLRKCMLKSISFLIFGMLMFAGVKLVPVINSNIIMTLLVKVLLGAFIYLFLSCVYFIKTKNQLFLDTIHNFKLKVYKK